MNIGELSTLSGVSRDTIRYYEKLALLPNTDRQLSSDYKLYKRCHLIALRQILALKSVGFTLTEIKAFDTASQSPITCDGLPERLSIKLAELDQKISTLQEHRAALMSMKSRCNSECTTGILGLPACVPTPSTTCCG